MKNIKLIAFIVCWLPYCSLQAQTNISPNPETGYYQYYINIKNDNIPENYSKADFLAFLSSENPALVDTLNNQIISLRKSFTGTKLTPLLKRSLSVEAGSPNLKSLLEPLTDKINFVEVLDFAENALLYEPNDMDVVGGVKEQLLYVKADKAWDLYRFDNRIKVGFTDTYLDVMHEDLAANIDSLLVNYPPLSGEWHGTSVAGVLSSVTNNDKGVASVSMNAPMIFSSRWAYNPEVVNIARIHGVRVINLSWVNSFDYRVTEDSLYQFILDSLNVVVVAGAGNNDGHCYYRSHPCYPCAYSSVLCVTSINHLFDRGHDCEWLSPPAPCLIKDLFEVTPGDTNSCHHYYPEVDICAPGHAVATTAYDASLHDKYTSSTDGTSFASPMVASTCALVAAYNPCLTAVEIRDIVIQSSNPSIYSVPENAFYTGRIGHGKLDVEAALKMAKLRSSLYQQNINYSGTLTIEGHTILAGYQVDGTQPIGNVTVSSGTNVTYDVYSSAELSNGFMVDVNGAFEIQLADSPCY